MFFLTLTFARAILEGDVEIQGRCPRFSTSSERPDVVVALTK